jgi:hypothetical protein
MVCDVLAQKFTIQVRVHGVYLLFCGFLNVQRDETNLLVNFILSV